MSSVFAILALGFFLGMRHATDPDHVVAVSTIVSRERSVLRAGLIGVLWGCGHTLTILAVGAAIILFGLAIPARVGLAMEFSVGLMLVLLGILNLSGALHWVTGKLSPAHRHGREHRHVHAHGPRLHSHTHSGEHHAHSPAPPRWLRGPLARLGLYQSLRPLLVGIVHGLAGSAAVALLVLGTIREPRWAVLYLLVFGVGTIAGMMLVTAALALPFSFAGNRYSWLARGLVPFSGLVSLTFGLFVSYQIAVVDGLFTGRPGWTPH